MPVGDDVLAVSAAHRLGLVRTDRWPMVAALLVAAGYDGEALIQVAGLPRSASGWEVDQLLPRMIAELDVQDLDLERAVELVVRLFGHVPPAPGYPAIRTLERLAPALGYPAGRIGEAYRLSEWIDCGCHEGSDERAEADRFEQDVRRLPPLRLPDELAVALLGV